MSTEKKSLASRLKTGSLVQAWLVLLLALGFGVSLAGVQLALGPVIEANKLNETLEKVPLLVLGQEQFAKLTAQNQVLDIEPRQVAVKTGDRTKYYPVYAAWYQDELRGWVIKAKGQGYADTVELLVGLSADMERITGMFVLEQKETPGLGNKIITESWRSQFIDMPTGSPLVAVKTGASKPGEIDAVTGATISSQSVATMINSAIGDLRGPLTDTPAPELKKGNDNG
ncbi:MAG: FMN-binding protein [Proteobacteria bacterium]|nr:MAG: FMN-binding protein [Pseudomonadota bacterium]PIE67920.1 MAG: FMN-binding protein [Deltaproteobacteria bacterium]